MGDDKSRISAKEEEVGKLHVNGVKILNAYCESIIKKIDAGEEDVEFLISVNDIKKIMDITHKEGFLAIDSSEDKTTELGKAIDKAAKLTGSNVLKFDDGVNKVG